jgi:MinD-like ATPase involved in chromosome partitioning or flagellar assembly
VATIAFSVPLDVEDRLIPEALRHGHTIAARCSSAQELASKIDILQPTVVIVAATSRHLTESLLAVCDGAGAGVLALISSEEDRRHAVSIGLFEMAPLDAPWAQMESSLAALNPVLVETVAPAAHGTVIAVWGPAGAPGRTTLAINIAAEIALAGHSVVLGDIDTYSGSIAPALGMLDEAPGFAAACRLAGAESLTIAELERIGQQYPSRSGHFWVLTGIGRPSRWPELSEGRVTGTIEACRRWAEYTVLDTGFSLEDDESIASDVFAPHRNAASLAALREADIVVAVGAADPVGLSRFLRAHVDLMERIAQQKVLVVMNKIRSSASGSNAAAQAAQTLYRFGGIDATAMIPFDIDALDTAVLTGKTLADAAPRSSARTAIRQFVTSNILPAATREVRHPPWWGRKGARRRTARTG